MGISVWIYFPLIESTIQSIGGALFLYWHEGGLYLGVMIKIKKHSYKVGLVASAALVSASYSIEVDTELLLLVDVSGSVDSVEYANMMGGYERAFRNSSVLDAIQSGQNGNIAASVVFWSGASDQQIGVDWMLIDGAESANRFADLLGETTRPFAGMTAIGSGIEYGTNLFGTETGGLSNGFESVAQIIDVSGDGTDNNTPPDSGDRAANLRAARDASLAAGVDMINGLPIGNAGGALEQYYVSNVIGGSAGGVDAFTQAATDFSDVEDTLVLKLQREVSAGATASTSVPEPSTPFLVAVSISLLVLHRRR